MRLLSWLREQTIGQLPKRPDRKHRPRPRPGLRLEALEERYLLSTLTVLNPNDSGAGSLRAEISAARSNDTIVFAPGLDGQTIQLTSGELLINKNLTIAGPGAGQLTISGNNASRVFEVGKKTTGVTLSGLTISNGLAADGGGILNQGTLTIGDSTLSGNHTLAGKVGSYVGGAIHNYGSLTVSDSILSGNSALSGGGIASDRTGTLTISNSTLSLNTARNSGGGINSDGTLTVSGGTLSGNFAPYGGAISATGTMTVSDSTLSGNSATYYGGAINTATNYYTGGTFTVSGCTLSNNSAYSGGGIDDGAGTLKIINGTTLSGNTAVYHWAGILTVSGGTLTNNVASTRGGGIYVAGGSLNGSVTINNSSNITGNTAPAGYGADVDNLGLVYLDASIIIGILDGNPAVPI